MIKPGAVIRTMLALALCVVTAFAAPAQVFAQATTMPANNVEAADDLAERVRCRRAASQGRTSPECEKYDFPMGTAPPPPDLNGAGRANGLLFVGDEAQQTRLGDALYTDYIRTLDHNYELFRWQLVSTKVSFAVTILLVLCGVVFSAMQFWKTHRAVGAGAPMPTELELSGGRVKVSSPVLGVIILVISLGFFYLFMLHAYPIEEVRRSAPASTSSQ